MNIHWIILSFQLALLTVSFTVEAGKKGSESGIIVINNTGGGKCGGSAKTIVKTGAKGKKGKGGKGKGHTIIASSGGGGGGCSCGDHGHHEESKVVTIPVPVPVTYHDNKFMARRTVGYDHAASGTRMMPVFVSANSPVSIAGSSPASSMISSAMSHYPYGVSSSYGGDIAVAASTNPFINPFTVSNTNAYSYMTPAAAASHQQRPVGDRGLLNPSEARQMFSLLPAQQLGHHFAHSVSHSNSAPYESSSGNDRHHGYPQMSSYGAYGDSGYLNHQPTPFNSMPIYEPIRPEEDYMGNVNQGDERSYHNHGGSSSSSSSSHSSDGPSSSSSSSMDDDESRNYQSAALSPSSSTGSRVLRKPSNYDDTPASPSLSPLSSPQVSSSSSSQSSSVSSEKEYNTKDKSGYWPERRA